MDGTSGSDHPSATYRGYRRQALYSLHRLLARGLGAEDVVQPEGKEDLAVFGSSGSLVEVVQVKDHSDPLTFSSFRDVFYSRVVEHARRDSAIPITIAHFGELGGDFADIRDGDASASKRLSRYMVEHGIGKADADRASTAFRFEHVDQDSLEGDVLHALSSCAAGIDGSASLDLLMYWVTVAAERRTKLTREATITKLSDIGRFLAGRAAFHSEWHTSIVPLDGEAEAGKTRQELAEEFYRGTGARYAHIAQGLDVPREGLLRSISRAFTTSRVVVLRGASGQGKSALGYRYCMDFAPSALCYRIAAVDDTRHAHQIALALSEHVKARDIPALVFLDVTPGNDAWQSVVQGLDMDGIRVLVAIRQEDWQRSGMYAFETSFEEVDVSFNEVEARELYRQLPSRTDEFVDFDDAWARFGGKGPLMEFVFLLTHTETLRGRLTQQVACLRDGVRKGDVAPEELDLLTYVAIATASEATLDLRKLPELCSVSDMQRTLQLFEQEYLLRVAEDGRSIAGLHGIRSEILSELLTDPVLRPLPQYAAQCIPYLSDETVENYLLHLFSRRPEATEEALDAISGHTPDTWAAACGILRGLIWLGVKEYAEENVETIAAAKSEFGVSWLLAIDQDVGLASESLSSDLLDLIGESNPEHRDRALLLRASMTPKERVFRFLVGWLASVHSISHAPESQRDHVSQAEVLFWIGRLGMENRLHRFDPRQVAQALDTVHPGDLARYFQGIRECYPTDYEDWLTGNRETVLNTLSNCAGFIAYEETSEAIIGHFLIPGEHEDATLQGLEGVRHEKASLDHLTIQRNELLGAIFPGKARYGAVGYGHRLALLPMEYDAADRPGMLASAIVPPWPPRVNSLFRGLTLLADRPDVWSAFAAGLVEIRQSVLGCFRMLRNSLALHRKQGEARPVVLSKAEQWDKCLRALGAWVLLPRVAVDEWGLNIESLAKEAYSRTALSHHPAIVRFAGLLEGAGDLRRHLDSFFQQAIGTMIVLPEAKAARSEGQKRRIFSKYSYLRPSEHLFRQSLSNLADAIKALDRFHLELENGPNALLESMPENLAAQEAKEYRQTLSAWLSFLEPSPSRLLRKGPSRKHRGRQKKRPATGQDKAEALLGTIRNAVKGKLKGLNDLGIKAQVLSESIRWEGRRTLWIRCDVDHPVDTIRLPDRLWACLQEALQPYAEKYNKLCTMMLMWQNVVVVYTVGGRSFGRMVYPGFAGAQFPQPALELQAWRGLPVEAPERVWDKLGIDMWQMNAHFEDFGTVIAEYMALLHQIGRLADLDRVPSRLQKIRADLLKACVDTGIGSLRRTYDRIVGAIETIIQRMQSLGDRMANSEDLRACRDCLANVCDSLEREDVDEDAMDLTRLCAWSQELHGALPLLGLALMLWTADAYGFPSYGESRFRDLLGVQPERNSEGE